VASREVLAGLGLEAEVRPMGGLAPLVVDALKASPDSRLVVTGRAQTIKVVRAAVKDALGAGVPTTAKAYWDEDRTGLD
jgi:hypothetical protein